MINLGDRLHAATEQGVLGGANEIFDDTQNKMQSTINAEVQVSLGSKADVTLAKKAIKLAKAAL